MKRPFFNRCARDIYRARAGEVLDKGLALPIGRSHQISHAARAGDYPGPCRGGRAPRIDGREKLDPDFVIVRSDGQPVFHFVNVVDDLEMRVSHVIRGEDHLPNTAKHIALFRAFATEPPCYAHIPLILNPDGSKMSKRDRGASLQTYIDDGYAPEAVVNYLCLLGWSPKENREKVPLAEIVKLFDLPQVLRHNARFDIDKLHWLDGEYIREMSEDRFRELGAQALARAGYDVAARPPEYTRAALATCKGKIKRFRELGAYAGFYFETNFVPKSYLGDPPFGEAMRKFRKTLDQLNEFNAGKIEETLKGIAKEMGEKKSVSILVTATRLASPTLRPGRACII